MKKILVKVGVIFNHLNAGFIWLTAVLLAFAWLSVCFEVFSRSLLNRPTQWTLEISEKILVFITFLGAAWLLKKDGHIKINMFVMWLPPKAQRMLNFFTSLISCIACLVVVWYSVQVVWEQFQMDFRDATVLELPLGPLYIVIPVGFFLLSVQLYRNAHGYLISSKLSQTEKRGKA